MQRKSFNMNDFEKLLLNKGVTETFLNNIKKRKVIFINSKFYSEKDKKANVVIETSKNHEYSKNRI